MKQLFLTLLFTTFLSADSYPKLFAPLGTPLYKADEVFEKFVAFPQVREKADPYHEKVYKLLELANKIEHAKKPSKIDKKTYINGLRGLQKDHDEIMRSINAYLIKSIDADNYKEFTRIVNTGAKPILENNIILKRSMAYYVTYRTRGKINVLESYYETLESDPSLMKYVRGHMPRVYLAKNTYKSGGKTHSLSLSNNEKYAFSANGKHCLKSLDIKNYQQTSKVGGFDYEGIACNLVEIKKSTSGKYLFLSDSKNGFTILDITNPKYPLQKDEWTKIRAISSLTTEDSVTSFIVRKNKGLLILDIYNKDEFRLLANYNKGLQINHLALDSNRSKLYLAHSEGLSVLDISTLGNPREVYTFKMKYGANQVILSPDQKLAYVASGDEGINVLDLSQDLNITKISNCLTPKYAYNLTLSKEGDKLYVSALEDGVYLLNTQDAKELKHIATYKTNKKGATALSSTLNKKEDVLFISYGNAGLAKMKL